MKTTTTTTTTIKYPLNVQFFDTKPSPPIYNCNKHNTYFINRIYVNENKGKDNLHYILRCVNCKDTRSVAQTSLLSQIKYNRLIPLQSKDIKKPKYLVGSSFRSKRNIIVASGKIIHCNFAMNNYNDYSDYIFYTIKPTMGYTYKVYESQLTNHIRNKLIKKSDISTDRDIVCKNQ